MSQFFKKSPEEEKLEFLLNYHTEKAKSFNAYAGAGELGSVMGVVGGEKKSSHQEVADILKTELDAAKRQRTQQLMKMAQGPELNFTSAKYGQDKSYKPLIPTTRETAGILDEDDQRRIAGLRGLGYQPPSIFNLLG